MTSEKIWEMNKRLYRALSHEALLEAADELTDMAKEREQMIKLIVECDKYLDTNNLTSIGHDSILHKKMKGIIEAANDI